MLKWLLLVLSFFYIPLSLYLPPSHSDDISIIANSFIIFRHADCSFNNIGLKLLTL